MNRRTFINKKSESDLRRNLEYCKEFGVNPLLNLTALPSLPCRSSDFPHIYAFYFFIEGDNVLYLGKTNDLKKRIGVHLVKKKENLNKPSVSVAWLEIKSIQLYACAELIEIYFMSRFYPLYNLDYNIYRPCPLMKSQIELCKTFHC